MFTKAMKIETNLHEYLQQSLSKYDSALIGCRADPEIQSHECCEFDVISIANHNSFSLQPQLKNNFGFNASFTPIIEFIEVTQDTFYNNPRIFYSDFVSLPKSSLRTTTIDHFKRKSEICGQNIEYNTRFKAIQNIYNITTIINDIDKPNNIENLSSLYAKMYSLHTLVNYLQKYLRREVRPCHIRSQIKCLLENEGSKTGEVVISLLDLIDVERVNKSSLARSEVSLNMLLNDGSSLRLSLLKNKINYLKSKSMYVDAMLLLYHFVMDYYDETEQNKQYPEILKRIIDIPKKEKMTLLKEMKLLIEFNKNLL